jgi:hypothetical protein
MMLLFIWVVVVLAVPKVSMIVAAEAKDVPSAQEVQSEKDTAMTQIMAEGQTKIRNYFREKSPDMSTPEKRAAVMTEVSKMQEEMFTSISKRKAEIDAEYESKKTAQFLLASRISRISPASVYTYASTSLARTGFDRQERFLQAARAYQVGFVQYFNEVMAKLMQRAGRSQSGEGLEEVKFEVDKLPVLDFQEASVSESWNSAVLDFLILFLILVCFFMVGYIGFIRSDVR